MRLLAHLQAYSMMGEVHLVATVLEDTLGGTTEPMLHFSTAVPDDGECDPHEWLRGALSAALEYLYDAERAALPCDGWDSCPTPGHNHANSPERPTDRVSTWGAPRG